jgi:hypothetical protein
MNTCVHKQNKAKTVIEYSLYLFYHIQQINPTERLGPLQGLEPLWGWKEWKWKETEWKKTDFGVEEEGRERLKSRC